MCLVFWFETYLSVLQVSITDHKLRYIESTLFLEIHKTLQDSSTTDVVRSLATPTTGWEPNYGKGLGGMQPEELEKDVRAQLL